MNIVVWGINYAPEETGIGPYNRELCEFLTGRGHSIRMVTTFSYYPQWRKSPGDRWALFRTDTIRGLPVHRCWHYVPPRPTAWKRMVHEASFAITSIMRQLFLPRPDVIVVISPPLLLGCAAWLLSRLKRTPFAVHVQDMQPDAAIALGLLQEGRFTRLLFRIERFTYGRAGLVSAISEGMMRLLEIKGVPASKRLLFPNWIRDLPASPAPRGRFRQDHGIAADEFLAVYAGNLGRKQGLGTLFEAARYLSGSEAGPVRIVVAGDGVEKEALVALTQNESSGNVLLLPLLSADEHAAMLADADVGLVPQERGSGSLFFPSKLLGFLAAGLPVVAVADPGGELESAVIDGGFGWTTTPDDPRGLARLLIGLAADRPSVVRRGAQAAPWVKRFAPRNVLPGYEAELQERFAPGR